jgi:hypothetical protein
MNAMGRAVLELLKVRLFGGSGMYFSPKTILIAASLLVASVSLAQEGTPSAEDAVLARLSYDNSGLAQPESVFGANRVMHVCLAVSKDGDYRIERLLERVRAQPGSSDDGVQRLRGNLRKEEFHQLSNLLEAADFRSLSGNRWPGVIRREAETFAAEIAVNGQWHDDGHGTKWLEPESWRRQWLNADGEAPFPSPVAKVVEWLKKFEPKSAKRFERTEFPDVCPSARPRLVQPSLSENLRP